MRKKKGFTVLELIIVIAVIGILAGVLIPTFMNMNHEAMLAVDKNTVADLNKCLALEQLDKDDTPNYTMHDAVKDASKHGYGTNDFISKSGVKILWNKNTNSFLLETDKDEHTNDLDYWTVSNVYDEYYQQYSIYAGPAFNQIDVNNLHVGFDAGDNNNIKNINYVNASEQNAILRTNNNTNITITAPKDTVKHYGSANSITINEIAANSYHEYGAVNNITITKGRLVVEDEASISNIYPGDNSIVASSSKNKIRNIIFHNIDCFSFQLVGSRGNTLLNTLGYVDNNGYALFEKVSTGELINHYDSYIDDEIVFRQLSHNELLINHFKRLNHLSFDVDMSLTYKGLDVSISGSVYLNLNHGMINSYQADLSLRTGFRNQDFTLTYVDHSYYLSGRYSNYIFEASDINTLINIINEIDEGISLPNNFFGLNMNHLLDSINNASCTSNSNDINYESSYLTASNVSLKSTLNHDLISISFRNNNSLFSYEMSLEVNNNAPSVNIVNPAISNSDFISHADGYSESFKLGLVDQLKEFINLKQAGIAYNIEVSKDNVLTFNTNGRLDLNLLDEEGNEDIKVNLSGEMSNPDSDAPLASTFNISYMNETAYLNYNNRLKLAYSKAGLEGLINIIKTRLTSNQYFEDLMGKFFPDSSTSSAPLLEAFKNKEYWSLLTYYHSLSRDNDNNVVVNFSSDLLGGSQGLITLTINKDTNEINKVLVNNVYAFGYYLDCEFTFDSYQEFSVNNPNSYTQLDYFNNILTDIMNIVDTKKHALSLSGSISSSKGTTTITGTTQFAFGENENYGVANVSIRDHDNKVHNLAIDITNQKVSANASEEQKRQALKNSQIYFNYNGNLKGKMALGSFTDLFALFKELADNNDERFEKYQALLTADFSRSSLLRLFNGEVEAILYDDLLNNITYNNNTYTIDLNNQILKNNGVDVGSIYLDIRLDDNHHLLGATLRGTLLDYTLNLDLNVTTYNPNYSRLNKNDNYYDFSDLKTLADYLLTTAKNNDFSLSGKLNASLSFFTTSLGSINLTNVDVSAIAHIEKDANGEEKVYVKVTIDVPYLGIIYNNDSSWDSRKFIIYFTDDEVYLRTETLHISSRKTDKHGSILVWKWTYYHNHEYTYKDVKLTMDEFFNNILYYIGNFGFDLEKDLNGYSGKNANMDYSKLINSYSFATPNNIPTWTVGINMKEITGKDEMGTLNATIKGNPTTKLLSSLTANMKITIAKVIIINANFDASLVNVNPISTSIVNATKNYINQHKNQSNRSIYTSNETIRVDE